MLTWLKSHWNRYFASHQGQFSTPAFLFTLKPFPIADQIAHFYWNIHFGSSWGNRFTFKQKPSTCDLNLTKGSYTWGWLCSLFHTFFIPKLKKTHKMCYSNKLRHESENEEVIGIKKDVNLL